jgi:DNA-binding MarR family transcriptional regulator
MEFGELLQAFLMDLQALFRTRLRSDRLTLPQVLSLTTIPDDGLDMTSIARHLGVDNSTATRLVDGLVRKGLVTKGQDASDRRVTRVRLTNRGEILQNRLEEQIDHLGQRVYAAIPPEDREEVKEILTSFHWTVAKLLLKQNKFV